MVSWTMLLKEDNTLNSNAKDFKGLSISDKINLVESLGGPDTGLGDPLTQFLLQVGPNVSNSNR